MSHGDFRKENKQNGMETAIASNDIQFTHKYTRYKKQFKLYRSYISFTVYSFFLINQCSTIVGRSSKHSG